jgi:AmmeMemoRadiSam system protein A
MSTDNGTLMLDVARSAIQVALDGSQDEAASPIVHLTDACGVFVTLMLNNQLRGCIGCITSFDPLHKTIPYYAVQSATQDHRFSPLRLAELPNVVIKLSVLTPPSPIGSINEIVLGTHGVIFSYQAFKSVFLPEVATEQGWDLETTLRHLESKAGAPDGSWQNAEYAVFESQIYSE